MVEYSAVHDPQLHHCRVSGLQYAYYCRSSVLDSHIIFSCSTVCATTGLQISIKYAIQILAAFIHPGNPMWVRVPWRKFALVCKSSIINIFGIICSAVMYVNLYGNSTAYQTLAMLQGIVVLFNFNFKTGLTSISRSETGPVYKVASTSDLCCSTCGLNHWLDL